MNSMAEQLSAKELTTEEIVALAEQALNDKGFRADDIQIRDADTLLELTDASKRAVILVAAWLGERALSTTKWLNWHNLLTLPLTGGVNA